MKGNKLIGLQILRGLAAWLVVMHHFNNVFFNWEPPIKCFKFLNYGYYGVDIFFVLSGFIMFYSIKNNTKGAFSFFLDRLFRIIPVYWFMTLLLVISFALLPVETYNTSYTLESLFKSLFFIPSLNPKGIGHYPFLYVGWTLIYELFFYAVLTISMFISKNKALIITSIILIALPILLKNYRPLGLTNKLLYEFVFGIIIAYGYSLSFNSKYSKVLLNKKNAIPLLFIIITSGYFAITHYGFKFHIKLLGAGLILILFLLIEDFVRDKKWLYPIVLLGDFSYSTYLIHPIILGWYVILYKTTQNILIQALTILLFIYTVYILSKKSFKYIERNILIYNLKEKIKTHYDSKNNKT